MSFASDGRDNTAVASAICDIITKKKVAALGLDVEKNILPRTTPTVSSLKSAIGL